jgi:hypothetical protein
MKQGYRETKKEELCDNCNAPIEQCKCFEALFPENQEGEEE